MTQLLLNTMISGAVLSLVGVAFALVRTCNGFFDLSVAAVLTVGAYGAFYSCEALLAFGLPPFLSFLGAATCGATLGGLILLATNALLYSRMRRAGAAAGALLVAGWACYLAAENLLAITLGHSLSALSALTGDWMIKVADKRVSAANAAGVVVSLCVIAASVTLMGSPIALALRCVASNPLLAAVRGIDVERARAIVALWAGGMAGLAGTLLAADAQISPRMGFDVAVNGISVLLVGGDRPAIVAFTAYGLALMQQSITITMGSQWQNFAVFATLLLALTLRGK